MLRPEVRPPSDPERVLGNALVLDNARFRLLGVTPAWTRYLVLDFRFAAVSDEKREGLLRLVINRRPARCRRRVRADAPWLDSEEGDSTLPDEALPPAWERRRVLDLLAEALQSRLDAKLAPFLKGLRRRLSRDQERLHAYHDDLHREAMRVSPRCRRTIRRAGARSSASGDRARIPRQDRRSCPPVCDAGHGRLGADPGADDAGAALRGADPATQGAAGDPSRLEPARTAARVAGLRVQPGLLNAPGWSRTTRCISSRQRGSRLAPVAASRSAAPATGSDARNAAMPLSVSA